MTPHRSSPTCVASDAANHSLVTRDASNVMLVHKGKPTRVGYQINSDGAKVRIAKRTGEVIS